MKKRTAGALFAGILLGALSAFVCGFVGLVVLMYLGDRYRHNYEYYIWLWWLIPLIGGLAGFYSPFRWILRRGCRSGEENNTRSSGIDDSHGDV